MAKNPFQSLAQEKGLTTISSPGSSNKNVPRVAENTNPRATLARGDRNPYAYAAASPTARPHTVSDELISNLQRGKRFISTYSGTSQYSIGGPSACGLASMNAVLQVLSSYRKGYQNLAILRVINRQEFHESVVDICSFLRDTGHLEIEELHNLPVFQRSMDLATAEYRQCSFESFTMLLNQLSDRSDTVESPVAAVITKSPEIIAVMCITTDEEDALPPHVYVVFDSHARPDSHPNGSAFLFFPRVVDAASYLTNLLRVDESLLDQRDLKWQSEMLTAYSAHIFTQPSLDDEEDPHRRSAWSMLYETSVELVQARGRMKSLEQKIADMRNENSRLSERLKSTKETPPVPHDTYLSWSNSPFARPPQPKARHSAVEDTIVMTDEQYAKFLESRGRNVDATQSTSRLASGSGIASSQPRTDFTSAYRSHDQPQNIHSNKGKGREQEPGSPWMVDGDKPIYHAWATNRMNSDPFASDADNSLITGSDRYHADRDGFETRRLQLQETQDEKSHELALRLDQEERERAVRHAFEPPPLFPLGNKAISSAAGALAGFVGNISSFARPTADKKPSAPTRRPHSTSRTTQTGSDSMVTLRQSMKKDAATKTKPASQTSDFMVTLRQQMKEDEEARSKELARRLQRDEEAGVLRESSNFVNTLPRPPANQPSFVDEQKQRDVVSSTRPLQYPRGAVRVEIERPPATLPAPKDEESRLAALKMQLDELNQQKSLELARQIEEEERTNAELIASLSNQKKFDCGVCMDEYPLDHVTRVDDCEHQFCRSCFKAYLASQLDDGAFPILCPTCKAEKASKPSVVASSLAEQLGLTDKQYEQWSKLDLQRYSLVIDCPHCHQSSLVDRDDYASSPVVSCPLPTCRGQWCKDCSQRVDPTVGPHSCDGQKEMDNYIRQTNLKRCPGCSTPTEKTMGCNHMTCGAPGCNTHFCWIDGQKIITSIVAPDIQAAIQTHYNACKLFDY